MPKITFLNLPEDKKETLIEAAKKEFSRVPLFEASISNIIKTAGIPRGSFYQYFEDKEDAYFYLLEEFLKEKKTQFICALQANKGDIFGGMIDFFDYLIHEKENLNFLKNSLLNMTHKIESKFENMFSDAAFEESYQALRLFIDGSYLNVSSEKEWFHAIQLLFAITFRNLIQTFARETSYEEAMDNYRLDIQLIKNGLARS